MGRVGAVLFISGASAAGKTRRQESRAAKFKNGMGGCAQPYQWQRRTERCRDDGVGVARRWVMVREHSRLTRLVEAGKVSTIHTSPLSQTSQCNRTI
jgi:hypothetical protein